MWRSASRTSSILFVVGLFIVLGVLAVLQYQWTGELSDAETERMRRTAAESSRRMCAEFDGRIASVVAHFRFDPNSESLEGSVTDAFARLGPDDSRLVGGLWLVVFGDDEPGISRLDEVTFDWLATEPPAYLRRLLVRGPGSGRGFRLQPVLSEGPAIVLPVGPRDPVGGGPRPGPSALVVVELDRQSLTNELLQAIVGRVLGDDEERDWSVTVIDRFDRSFVYRTDGDPAHGQPDAEGELLGSNLSRAFFQDAGPAPVVDPAPRGPAVGRPPGAFRGPRPEQVGPIPGPGAWRLELRYRDGTLQDAVLRSRRRNLALSGAVLVLLATGGLIIIANAHKSRALATQQLEFVAAVTHELNTPIAAISSAGQNLADGVVREPEQIRRYGDMIAREGRRLSAMVDHVLEFAGMQRSAHPVHLQPHPVGKIVDHALSTMAMTIEESGVQIEKNIRDAERVVLCDRDALARAVANLLSNAIKYRGDSSRIEISARVDETARQAVFSVKDEGLGLGADERKRIFEPFSRGTNAHAHAIRGSGLGLSIVQRIVEEHRGRVTVESTPGRGSVFSIRVPVSS